MVCEICNGKGYLRIKDEELRCGECLGRGEYLLSEVDKLRMVEVEECRKAYCAGAVSG